MASDRRRARHVVRLRRAAAGRSRRTTRSSSELQTLQVRLQQERAEAQRTDNLRQLLELRERAELDTVAAEVIAGAASPEFRTVTIDKGIVGRPRHRHGGDLAGRRRRPRDPAEPRARRRCSC